MSATSTYTVAVGAFQGPFDLLLHLIARRKVDIHEIPLAAITDDYLAVLREMETVDLEVTTEFLLVAATLLELKAARLLPVDETDELDELALEARDLLYARLLEYRSFKQAADFLARTFADQRGFHPRQLALEPRFAAARPAVTLPVGAGDLAGLAALALAERPPEQVDLGHVQPVRLTVRDAARMVSDELQRAGGRATFAELTAGCRHRIESIVCFLAVLELYKFEQIELDQARTCGELVVSSGPGLTWNGAPLVPTVDQPVAVLPADAAGGERA
ncbi:MAG: segregation and condensation protein A [Egibacteraceae bacterium]